MKAWFALTIPLLLAQLVSAQQPLDIDPAPELTQLRKKFATKALGSTRTLSEQFIRALSVIERESAMKGDYERGLAAQKRRQELEALFASSLEAIPVAGTLVLKADAAKLSGAISFDRATGCLSGWKTVGSVATWDVQRIQPGRYDIVLVYGVAPIGEISLRAQQLPFTGGTFDVFEDSSLAGASGNRVTSSVKDTGSWQPTTLLNSGAFRLDRTSTRLSIRITATNGDGGVMCLKEVRLVPSKAVALVATVPASTPDAALLPLDPVKVLQDAERQKVQMAAIPILSRYLDQLSKLQKTQAETNTPDGEEAASGLTMEIARTQRWLNNPAAALGRQFLRDHQTLAHGIEEWQNVSLVADSVLSGHKFTLRHDGGQAMVKVLGVFCPTPDKSPASEMRQFAKYFSVDQQDATNLATQAKKFAASLLQGKSLRVFTRGTTDRDGAILVSIQIPGLGDYAGALVDNGLASISLPNSRRSPGTSSESDLLSSTLKKRETTARGRQNAPGGWAYQDPPSVKP